MDLADLGVFREAWGVPKLCYFDHFENLKLGLEVFHELIRGSCTLSVDLLSERQPCCL